MIDMCRTVIRETKGGANAHEVSTPQILSCDELRNFWLSWRDGYVEVGHGRHAGSELIARWRDETPLSVHEISVTTTQNSEGYWEFDSFDTDQYIVFTPKVRVAEFFYFDWTMILKLWIYRQR